MDTSAQTSLPGLADSLARLGTETAFSVLARARELERLQPQPALFPDDPEQRAAVEEAERFGDEELQHPIRQISWWSIKKDSSSLRSYSEGAKLGIPIGLAVKTAAPIVALAARTNEATDENVRRDQRGQFLVLSPAGTSNSGPGSASGVLVPL